MAIEFNMAGHILNRLTALQEFKLSEKGVNLRRRDLIRRFNYMGIVLCAEDMFAQSKYDGTCFRLRIQVLKGGSPVFYKLRKKHLKILNLRVRSFR